VKNRESLSKPELGAPGGTLSVTIASNQWRLSPWKLHRIACRQLLSDRRWELWALPLQARLMPCIGSPTCQPITHSATSRTVDLAVIVELAKTDDHQAPGATNSRTNPVFLNARTSTAALEEVAPPVRPRAPSPSPRPRATRRLRALHLGLHLFRGHPIAYVTSRIIATSRPTPRCDVSSESRRSLRHECLRLFSTI